MTAIKSVQSRLFQVPLPEVLGDAMHGAHHFFELITATVTLEDGSEGTGYTYTGGKGGYATKAMLDHDLAPALVGKDATDVEKLNDFMEVHIHYVGRGGIASFAISAVDIALWDIRCKKAQKPLWQVAGGAGSTCNAYRGGIDLMYTQERLVESVKGYLHEGFRAVKIKVGLSYDEDVARVKAVREAIGAETTFMVDANYALSVEDGIKWAKGFEPYNIFWFEEPTIPDDFEGFKTISEGTTIPLAMGENCHTIYEHKRALSTSNLSFIQPDASNCGGCTGFLRVAKAAAERGIPVCSHGMQELHVSLVSSQPNAGWLEVHSFPIDEYTTGGRPPLDAEGRAIAPDTPGTGVVFNWEKLAPFEK